VLTYFLHWGREVSAADRKSSSSFSNCCSSSSNCLTVHFAWITAVINFAIDKCLWRVQMDHRVLLWTLFAVPSYGLTSRCLRIYLMWTRNELGAGPPTAGSGPDEKEFWEPSKQGADRLKIFTLNRKDRLPAAKWLGLGLKSLICKWINIDTTDQAKNIRKIDGLRAPFRTAGPLYFVPAVPHLPCRRHCLWQSNYTTIVWQFPPLVWAVGWLDYLNTIKEPTGSCKG